MNDIDVEIDEKIKKVKEMPEKERPREKLLNMGVGYLTNPELIAILLDSGIKGKNVIEVSKSLIDYAGGLDRLAKFDVSTIQNVKGIGLSKACKIVAAFELNRRVSKIKSEKENIQIMTPQDVIKIFAPQFNMENVEIFKVIMLDTKSHIISDRDISRGIVDASLVSPREVYKEAITRHASKIIAVHNHPSGIATPSTSDVKITESLKKSGEILDIPLIDHIIYGSENNYYSFKQEGRI